MESIRGGSGSVKEKGLGEMGGRVVGGGCAQKRRYDGNVFIFESTPSVLHQRKLLMKGV